jgi:asparagine synthase (glutamine-hydrolysing)
MCAIFGVFNIKGDYSRVRKLIIKMLKRLQPRGPDATGVAHFQVGENTHHFICHQRLSIVDPFHGDQPFYGETKKVCCAANGEIYNHFQVIIYEQFIFLLSFTPFFIFLPFFKFQ